MPLMVAARSGLVSYVETLCAHKDIILNQQDSNGFTALIKVAFRLKELQDEYGRVKGYMKYKQCCEILIDHGIDYRIIDSIILPNIFKKSRKTVINQNFYYTFLGGNIYDNSEQSK